MGGSPPGSRPLAGLAPAQAARRRLLPGLAGVQRGGCGRPAPPTWPRRPSSRAATRAHPQPGSPLAGADAEFLRAAFRLSRNSVYSLHKSSTRDYIQRLAERELRARSGAGTAAARKGAAAAPAAACCCCAALPPASARADGGCPPCARLCPRSRGAGAAAVRPAGHLQVPQVRGAWPEAVRVAAAWGGAARHPQAPQVAGRWMAWPGLCGWAALLAPLAPVHARAARRRRRLGRGARAEARRTAAGRPLNPLCAQAEEQGH